MLLCYEKRRKPTVLTMLVFDLQNELYKRRDMVMYEKVKKLRGDIACQILDKDKTLDLLCDSEIVMEELLECDLTQRRVGYNYEIKWHKTSRQDIQREILVFCIKYERMGKILYDKQSHVAMLLIQRKDGIYELNCWELQP